MSMPFQTREDYLASLRVFARTHGVRKIEDCWEGPGVYSFSVYEPGTYPVAYAERKEP